MNTIEVEAYKQKVIKQAYFQKIKYTPHAGQRLFHDSTVRFRFANCGRRYGKTLMVARDVQPLLLQPNKNIWIVGPTYDLAEKEFRVIWKDMIVGLGLGKDPSVDKVYNKRQGAMFIRFKKYNTNLEVRSAKDPDNLVGDSLDHVIMSEAAKHDPETWARYIRPALSDRNGSADFATTPEGFNWLYDEWMRGQDPTYAGVYQSWKFPTWMNDVMYPGGEDNEEIKLLKRTLSPVVFTQEIAADFGAFSGKIYGSWDVAKHVKKHEYRPDWPNYIAFDFGYTNPTAAIEFQVSPRDEIFVWREYYKSYTRLENVLQEMRERDQPPGYKIDLCFGDAADPEAIETISAKFAPCVGDPNAKTNWRDGIDLVSSFLERDEGEDDYGGPDKSVAALFVDPDCTNTIREFNNYKSDPKSNGTNTAEAARKQDDHAMDALRYGLVHIFRLGAIYRLSDAIEVTGVVKKNTPTPTPRPITDNVPLSSVNELANSVAGSNYTHNQGVSGSGLSYEIATTEGYFTQLGEF